MRSEENNVLAKTAILTEITCIWVGVENVNPSSRGANIGDTASDAIVDRILTRKPALYQDMRTFTDFKLLQLSWVFDLEFPYTRILADQRGELRAIADSLPDTEKIQQAVGVLFGQTTGG